MDNFDRRQHWEHIYTTKNLEDVSWYQPVPETSLAFLEQYDVPKTARIIDMGGGDSFLADHLLERGYSHITVLDISQAAIDRARARLGDRADHINWIVADAAQFDPTEQYDLWHDRAAFHFLTQEQDIHHYLNAARKGIAPGGLLVIGTFSEQGPKKCSGIAIRQYSEASMSETFREGFEKLSCKHTIHPTPFNTTQDFIFGAFRRTVDATT